MTVLDIESKEMKVIQMRFDFINSEMSLSALNPSDGY